MSRPCTVCNHPERQAIDAALVTGTPQRDLAGRHGLSQAALQRHNSEHLPAALLKAKDAGEVAHADVLLKQVRGVQSRAVKILDKAEESAQLDTALRALREVRACIELFAKLTGDLDERPVVNVTLSPQWVELRAIIVQTLAPYPEARQAVARALSEGEAI
jgi:hypothetical protein